MCMLIIALKLQSKNRIEKQKIHNHNETNKSLNYQQKKAEKNIHKDKDDLKQEKD